MKGVVLVADDHEDMRLLLRRILEKEGCEVIPCASAEEGLRVAEQTPVDAVVADLRMETASSGLELLKALRSRRPWLPVIILSAHGSADSTIEAMQKGAFDFVGKPFEPAEIVSLVRRALDGASVRAKAGSAEAAQSQLASLASELVGESKSMVEVYKQVAFAASVDLTVVVQGETGTGKELVARAVHRHSSRAGRPFLALNSAALPDALMEEELFGHARGAYTGAHASKRGLLEEAHGGSLFLDEVAELSPLVQPKLLRAIEENTVRPLGATASVPVNVRIISATNKPLVDLVRRGLFREDLYYRLNVVSIQLPPLRERRDDIPKLVDHFVAKFAGHRVGRPAIGPELMDLLVNCDWPGNVRQLQHSIQIALGRMRGGRLVPEDFADVLDVKEKAGPLRSLAEVEEEYIQKVLAASDGNATRAAEILGIDRKTLHRKMRTLPPRP